VVARFGGDELVVLLRGVHGEQARAVATRIGELVAEPMPDLDGAERVTVSVGVAPVGDDAVDRADQAMLQAKRSGRDQVIDAADLAAG
jgi:diguanylate cyclase (GGDEF)-like protein